MTEATEVAELSEDRLRSDEIEIDYYGFSSTQLYLTCRKHIDNKIKLLMMELLVDQRNNLTGDKFIEILLKQYKLFWHQLEKPLQTFYEEIQNILRLPTPPFSSNYLEEIRRLCTKNEQEIESLRTEYIRKKACILILNQQNTIVSSQFPQLNEQVKLAIKVIKKDKNKSDKYAAFADKHNSILQETIDNLKKEELINIITENEKSMALYKQYMDSLENESN